MALTCELLHCSTAVLLSRSLNIHSAKFPELLVRYHPAPGIICLSVPGNVFFDAWG